MAETSIAAVVVEVSIAKVSSVTELLKAIQRQGIALLVFGKDTVEMRALERQGLVMTKIHGKPSATEAFVRQCVGMARVAANNLRLGSAEVLFVDRDEKRLASAAAHAAAPGVLFDPAQDDAGALRGRLGDYGLVEGQQHPRSAAR